MKDINKGKRYTTFIPIFVLGWWFKETPDNWLVITPIRVFGIFIGYKMICAKKGYIYSDGKICK
jgi:hypothetical protein